MEIGDVNNDTHANGYTLWIRFKVTWSKWTHKGNEIKMDQSW